MQELSRVWDRLTDVSRANILERIAGKRNANIAAALLENFKVAERALVTAQNSAGSALAENEKYLDSIRGKLDQLTASWQALSTNILSNEAVKGVVDLLRELLDFLNQADDLTDGWSTTILTATAALIGLHTAIWTLSNGTWSLFGHIKALAVGFIDFSKAASAGTLAANALSLSMKKIMLAAGAIGLLTIAVTDLYQAYKKNNPSTKEMESNLNDLEIELGNLQSELKTTEDRIKELQALSNSGTISLVEQDELERLKQQNDLLLAQKKLKEDERNRNDAQLAQENLDTLFARGPDIYDIGGNIYQEGTSRLDALYQDIDKYKSLMEQYRKAVEEGDTKLADKLKKQADELAVSMEDQMQVFLDAAETFDPTRSEEEAEALRKIIDAYDRYRLAVGDATIAKEVFDDILQRTDYEGASEQLQKLADDGELTVERLLKLKEADPGGSIARFIAKLEEIGLIKPGQLDLVINYFNGVADSARKSSSVVEDSINNIISAMDKLSANVDLIKSANKELSEDGAISLDTLKNMVEQYGELEESVALYLAGLKSGQDLLSEYKVLYDQDVEKNKKSLSEKLQTSAAFYNSLSKLDKQKIDDLVEAYKIDLGNYKDLETAKLRFQAGIVKQMLSNYSRYHNATLADMMQGYLTLSAKLKNWDKYNFGSAAEKADAERELAALEQTIKAIRDFDKVVDEITQSGLDDFDPSKFAPSNFKGGSDDPSYDEQYKPLLDEIERVQHETERLGRLPIDTLNEQMSLWLGVRNQITDAMRGLDTTTEEYRFLEKKLWDVNDAMNALSEHDYDEQYKHLINAMEVVEHKTDRLGRMGQDMSKEQIQMWSDMRDQILDAMAGVNETTEEYRYLEEMLWKVNDAMDAAYEKQSESINNIIDLTKEMIEEGYEDQIDAIEKQTDAYQELIDKKKEALKADKDAADYNEEVAEKVKEIAKLQSDISKLSLDDSREATAKRVALEEELAAAQKELAAIQADHSVEMTEQALDDEADAYEKAQDKRIDSIENMLDDEVQLYKDAISQISQMEDSFYDQLRDWAKEHGKDIQDLAKDWEIAKNAKQGYADLDAALMGISNASGSLGSLTTTGSYNSSEARAILAQMQANSTWAKQNSTRFKNGVDLHKENTNLAAQYEALTNEALKYDPVKGWVYVKTGKPAYIFHTGGVVGNGSLKDDELMAILQHGELVLADGHKENLAKLLDGIKSTISMMVSGNVMSNMRKMGAPAEASNMTFSPHLETHIHHNGSMTDEDAKRYGDEISQRALEQLRVAFNKRGY